MADRTMHSLIMIRNDTKANWATVNPTLLKGEMGIELDTRKFKVGDGTTAWNSLAYFGSSVVYGTLTNSSTFSTHDKDQDALYVDTSTKKIYRYNGTNYIVIGGGGNALFVGTENSTSATASSSNGSTYVHLYDADNSNNQKVKLTGSGIVKITNDNANIITVGLTKNATSTRSGSTDNDKLVLTNSSGYVDSTLLNFAGAISTVKDSNLTANKVVVSNNNGKIAVASNANALVLDALLKDVALTDIETSTTGVYKSILDLLGEKSTVAASATNGNISVDGSDVTVYSLPLATSSARGGIKIGYSQSGQNYPVQLDSEKAYVNVPWANTTYTFASGTNGFTVTPSGGTAETITVTPSITNNVIYSGTVVNNHLAKWSSTAGTLVDGPAYGTTGNSVLLQTDASGKISTSVLPDTITGQLYYRGAWNPSSANAESSTPEKGWYYIANADGKYDPTGSASHASGYYKTGDWAVYNGSSWDKIDNTDAVTGVKGNAESDYRIGNVNITAANIGLGNVNNTSDADKPISTATQTALNNKVNIDDILIIDCGHAGLKTTETGYEATYLGRWETIPTRS